MRIWRGLAALCVAAPLAVWAQPDRIAGNIDTSRMVAARGVVHPRIRTGVGFNSVDQGPVEASFRLPYIQLMTLPSAAQAAELDQLLAAQQNPASPQFRKWLTPEQYADRFGLSRGDLAKISAWLQSAGFSIEYTARARNWIAFSGTAAQVEAAFHTSVHRYLVNGETHYAVSAEPQLPEVVAPLVSTLLGMDDFKPKPQARTLTLPDDNSYVKILGHTLAPGDLATIFDINPLYQMGIDGTGQTIAVVGQTQPSAVLNDVQTFRSMYGLNPITIQPILVGANPGVVTADSREADLDLEYAGGIARNASLLFVYSASADTAAMYAIDQALAPIVSESFGLCELQLPSSYVSSFELTAKQGNSQGITWVAASGDSGAADCDPDTGSIASSGLAVQFPADIPEVTAAGATELNDGGANYWAAVNGANGGSALSYIPETAWNDTVYGTGLSAVLLSSGGGVSTMFSKASWQKGPGVPNDGQRDLPDLAMPGSIDHDAYDTIENGAPGLGGGTSAATPVIAGILALVNQYAKSNGLGNVNASLYPLSQSFPAAFHDITSGSNMVPCAPPSPSCVNGKLGYSAGPGFDLVTGLGSVDAYNLATGWSSSPASPPASMVTLTSLSPAAAAQAGLAFALTVNGSNFASGAVVQWNGAALPTTFLSGSQLIAKVSASLISSAATASVTVSSGAAVTGPLYFTVTPPSVAFAAQVVSGVAPDSCNGAPSATFFATNMTAYLFYRATTSPTDTLNADWLAPDGTTYSAGAWSVPTSAGTYCYWTNPLPLSSVPLSQYGLWTARVYGNGSLLFSVPFTVNCGMAGLPSISSVDSASSYGGYSYFAPGSWLEIKGTNLADLGDPRLTAAVNPGQWTANDFTGVNAPTSLDGISVSIDGKPAYVWYLSAGQLNVEAPQDSASGNVAITVGTCKGASQAFNFQEQALAPGLLAPPSFLISGKQYMAAQFYSDNAYVLSPADGAALGAKTRAASPGDLIVAYGIGFGGVTPSTLPGVMAQKATTLANPVTFAFGSTNATVGYQGLYPGFVGLYEFYITVPSGLAPGDYQINVTQNGTALPQTLYLTVGS